MDSGVGCNVGHQFAGALAYADDIVVLAPTRSALAQMLAIAGRCADALDPKFNGAKSQYIRYCWGTMELMTTLSLPVAPMSSGPVRGYT